jgi:hypothetical protein
MMIQWPRVITIVASFSLFSIYIVEAKGQYVYWRDGTVNGGQIFRTGADVANTEFILDAFVYYSYDIDPVDRKIYLAQQDDRIKRANHDGTGVENVFTSTLGQPLFLKVDPLGRKIYYYLYDSGSNPTPRQIRRVDLDGANDESLVIISPTTVFPSLRGFDLHLPSQSLYWIFVESRSTPPQLWKASLDGANPQMVTTLPGATPLR